MPAPAVSVLLPAYNEEALIARSVGAVHAAFAALPEPVAYEVIVCDNASDDRTVAEAEAAGARVVREEHRQIARARNTAARHARAPWLVFVDADTYLNPTLLQASLAALGSGRVCGGGSVLRFEAGPTHGVGRAAVVAWTWISTRLQLAAGSYVFCLREAWEAVGGFDERVYVAEELYFSRALTAWGRSRGLRFRILREAPIVTSARKLEWFSPWQVLWQIVGLLRPGAWQRREACAMWYTRPAP